MISNGMTQVMMKTPPAAQALVPNGNINRGVSHITKIMAYVGINNGEKTSLDTCAIFAPNGFEGSLDFG